MYVREKNATTSILPWGPELEDTTRHGMPLNMLIKMANLKRL
jgi:hypothetical protein